MAAQRYRANVIYELIHFGLMAMCVWPAPHCEDVCENPGRFRVAAAKETLLEGEVDCMSVSL